MRTALYGWVAALAFTILSAAPAQAQFHPQAVPELATGEQFHIEGSAGWWRPGADMTISSESLGIPGTTIDLKKDLGLEDKTLPELNLTLRPARNHKFRLQLIPIKFEQVAALRRTVVFNGQRYDVNIPVTSSLDWNAFRFGYEYDIITRDQGFAGFIVEAKYTSVRADLSAPTTQGTLSEFAEAHVPVPALGGIGRVYVVPNVSVTGELTLFKLPDSVDSRFGGHYVDLDIYGTVNFNRYLGAQAGYRSLDMGYMVKTDTGSFTLRGLYFGGVVRY